MSTNTRKDRLQSYWRVYFEEIDGLIRGFETVGGLPNVLYRCRSVVAVEATDGFVCLFYDNSRYLFRYAVLDQSTNDVLAALTYPVQIELDAQGESDGAIVELGELDDNEARAARFAKRTPCARAAVFRGRARLDMSGPAARAKARHDLAIAMRQKADRA